MEEQKVSNGGAGGDNDLTDRPIRSIRPSREANKKLSLFIYYFCFIAVPVVVVVVVMAANGIAATRRIRLADFPGEGARARGPLPTGNGFDQQENGAKKGREKEGKEKQEEQYIAYKGAASAPLCLLLLLDWFGMAPCRGIENNVRWPWPTEWNAAAAAAVGARSTARPYARVNTHTHTHT